MSSSPGRPGPASSPETETEYRGGQKNASVPKGPCGPWRAKQRAGPAGQRPSGVRHPSEHGRQGPQGADARAGPGDAGVARGGPGGTRAHAGRDLLSPPDEPPLPPEQLQQPHATLQCHRGAAR